MSVTIRHLINTRTTLLPDCLDGFTDEDNPARVIDVFVDRLRLDELGFKVVPADTGRAGYHPATMLKLYIYGYLSRIPSSRRLEREARRNVELMWLLGRLSPDFKTIADFRKDNGKAIRRVCREFVELCRRLELFCGDVVAIDGSKFKAVNHYDNAKSHGRTFARYAQVMDGRHTLHHENAGASEYGNELARAGIQHQTCAEDPGRSASVGRH